jgi:acetyl esterase/lipase
LPSKVISISPIADGTMSNPAIAAVDERDPTGARLGLFSTMKMYAGDIDLKDPRVSPINGSFRGFPPLYLFVASDDLLMPDQKLLALKAKSDNAPVEVIDGEGMFHIWVVVPFLKEGKRDWKKMISILESA